MERAYIGKCPKCGAEIYSENGMATRFCTHCGTGLGTNYGGMAYAYMEKDVSEEQQKKTAAQNITLEFDKSIPGFDVTQSTDMYAFKQEEINAKNRRRAAYIAGGVAAAVIALSAIVVTTGITKRNYNDVTEPVVEVVQDDPVEIEPVEVPVQEVPQVKKNNVKIEDLTIAEKDCVRKAERLLDSIPYSRAELIEELQDEYYGFSEEEATAAIDYMESAGLVSFMEEAAKWATSLAEDTSFSRAELLRMLSGEYSSHYTAEEAEYAVNYVEENNIVDWNEMAKKEAELYMSFMHDYTREELISQLMVGNQFTQSEAEYAANALGF